MPDFTALRSMVSKFLVDTCTISTAVAPEFDPEEGTYPDDEGEEVYSGVCRVAPSSGARVVVVGEGPTSLRLFDVTLPWDTTGIELDHLVTVTESGDPQMVGRVLRVVDVLGESDAAYRRLVCEDTLTVSIEEEGS